MNRMTNSQAVASGVASLILFATTLSAGYALAEDGIPTAGLASAATPVPPVAGAASPVSSARDELRIKSLHDRLKLTAAQEPLWNEVAEVMRSNDRAIDKLAKLRHDSAPKMTAIEDLRSYGEITEAHAAGIRAFAPVFGALYDSLTTAQKTNADRVFRNDDHKPHRKVS